MSTFGPQSEDPLAAPFWSAARQDRLVLPYDRATGRCCWYPHEHADIEWREVTGGARLCAWSVVRGPINPDFTPPYAPALVIPDGEPRIRLVTQIVDCDFAALRCDMPLELCFRTLAPRNGASFRAPVFRPV
jgi:uncharacterized OB-fold protein